MCRQSANHCIDSIVAAHPGLLQTELALSWLHNGCPSFLRSIGTPVINFLFTKIFLPPEYAVQTILYAATAPDEMVCVHMGVHFCIDDTLMT